LGAGDSPLGDANRWNGDQREKNAATETDGGMHWSARAGGEGG